MSNDAVTDRLKVTFDRVWSQIDSRKGVVLCEKCIHESNIAITYFHTDTLEQPKQHNLSHTCDWRHIRREDMIYLFFNSCTAQPW